MNTYTDTQLKQALAKMLPELINWDNKWKLLSMNDCTRPVLDTELLHLCWLVEETLTSAQTYEFMEQLQQATNIKNFYPNWTEVHAIWQQRTMALCKVKGVEL